MPKIDLKNNFNLRNKNGYVSFPNGGHKFNSSFFPNTTKIWNSIPKEIQVLNLPDFKNSMKKMFKPKRYKHFARGSKLGNILLTRIRVGRSDLNQHKFTVGHVDSPECLCHFRSESPEHYFPDCFLYEPERQILFGLIEHYVPFFKNLTKKKKLELMLTGINIENDDFLSTNTIIMKATQNFILNSKRFANLDI